MSPLAFSVRRGTRSRGEWLTLLATFCSLCVGCDSSGATPSDRVELVVYAASSLTEAFQELEQDFERADPHVELRLIFAGSQVLRLQLERGASADVFASADESHMQALVDAGRVPRSRIFARNELAIVVPLAAERGIQRFEELAQTPRIVVGTDSVPVGIYTRQLLERARAQLGERFVADVRSHIVSEESNVRLVRAKVELGEAGAAIVYRTDAASSKKVRSIPIPDALNVRANYPIGELAGSRHAAEATRFVDFVLSPAGRDVLQRYGFITTAE